MIRQDIKSFSKWFFKWLLEKPQGKWQALAHIYDRAMVGMAGVIVTVTAFLTSNIGMLVLFIWGLGLLVFGLWLVAHKR